MKKKNLIFLFVLPVFVLISLLTFVPYMILVQVYFLSSMLIILLFVMGLIDAIINKEANVFNFCAFVHCCIILEYVCKNNLLFYILFLIPLVGLLFLFNKFRKQNLFSFSTILVLIYTMIFTFSYQLTLSGVKKNLITKKYGYIFGHTCVMRKCFNYEIPIMYDRISLLSENGGKSSLFGSGTNIYSVSKDGKDMYINLLNEQILEEYDEAQYLGKFGFVNFFKVKNSDTKYGLAELYEKYEGDSMKTLEDLSRKTLVLPMEFDDIKLAYSQVSERFTFDTSYLAVIVQKNDKYALYAGQRKDSFKSMFFDFSLIVDNRNKIEHISFTDEDRELLKDRLSREMTGDDWLKFTAINVDDRFKVFFAPNGFNGDFDKYSVWIYDTVKNEFRN